MNFNFDSALLEAFAELDQIQEGFYDEINASKAFWAAAKNSKVDEISFHKAFDRELASLGLDKLFDSNGKLLNKGVYSEIKSAKIAAPDSWAIKALVKLWALVYIDNAEYQIDINERKAKSKALADAKRAEAAARRAEEEAAEKAVEEAKRIEIAKTLESLIPKALEQVDSSTMTQYLKYAKISESEFLAQSSIEVTPYSIKLKLPTSEHHPATSETLDTSVEALAQALTTALKSDIKELKEQSNYAIDVLDKAQKYRYLTVKAILLGESGTKYYVYSYDSRGVQISTKDFTSAEIACLADIPENYKVIYTYVFEGSTNNRTSQDTVTKTYYSWDSRNQKYFSELLPEFGHKSFGWSYADTEKVSSGGLLHSSMDDIDTWAIKTHTDVATD